MNKPLRRGTNLTVGAEEEDRWISIPIEKLEDFCYKCGRLGHVLKECEEEGSEDDQDLQYRGWMRESGNSNQSEKSRSVVGKEETGKHIGKGLGRVEVSENEASKSLVSRIAEKDERSASRKT